MMAFTVTDTHLILGEETAVERAIRALGGSGAESLNSEDWWRRARASIPSAVGAATFEDTSASAELLWWLLKELGKDPQAAGAMGPGALLLGPDELSEFVDVDLLPAYEAVKKYFGTTVMYGLSRPDGFYLEFKCLSAQTGP
jgi:hypothetical protein